MKKVPRKLKKKIKKRVLASHSESFLADRKLTTRKIRITQIYKDKTTVVVGIALIETLNN